MWWEGDTQDAPEITAPEIEWPPKNDRTNRRNTWHRVFSIEKKFYINKVPKFHFHRKKQTTMSTIRLAIPSLQNVTLKTVNQTIDLCDLYVTLNYITTSGTMMTESQAQNACLAAAGTDFLREVFHQKTHFPGDAPETLNWSGTKLQAIRLVDFFSETRNNGLQELLYVRDFIEAMSEKHTQNNVEQQQQQLQTSGSVAAEGVEIFPEFSAENRIVQVSICYCFQMHVISTRDVGTVCVRVFF
jgi:hypothetical protein